MQPQSSSQIAAQRQLASAQGQAPQQVAQPAQQIAQPAQQQFQNMTGAAQGQAQIQPKPAPQQIAQPAQQIGAAAAMMGGQLQPPRGQLVQQPYRPSLPVPMPQENIMGQPIPTKIPEDLRSGLVGGNIPGQGASRGKRPYQRPIQRPMPSLPSPEMEGIMRGDIARPPQGVSRGKRPYQRPGSAIGGQIGEQDNRMQSLREILSRYRGI